MKWLKRESREHNQPRVTLAFKRVFESDDGDIVLQDLARRVYGRIISDDASDQAVRAWLGEVKILRYILNKINNGE